MFFEGMSDTTSIVSSSEDDKWGAQIGGYNENHPSYPPPPSALLAPAVLNALDNAPTVNMEELEAMLDQGFDPHHPHSPLDTPPASIRRPNGNSNVNGVPPVPTLNRYQLSEGRSAGPPARPAGPPFDAFGPLSPGSAGGREPMPVRMRELSNSPGPGAGGPPPLLTTPFGVSTSTQESTGHARRRSGGRGGGAGDEDWGPLGPLGQQPPQIGNPPSSYNSAGPRGRSNSSTLKKAQPPKRI